jgi:zinc protease
MARLIALAAVIGMAATPTAAAPTAPTPTAAAPTAAVPAAPAAKPTGSSHAPALETFELPNGLRVALLRLDSVPAVSVQLWYHAGSKDEPRNRRGVAHMFEHIMFAGSAHVRPESHAQLIAGIGGHSNAATDEDSTRFIDTLPSDYLDFAIELEAERMRQLLFRKPTIDAGRALVKDEIQQQEGSPVNKAFLRFLSIAYTTHPYAWTAGGNAKDLDGTTPDDLRKFYDAYYQPNNAMLVVVGKASAEDVKASAEKWFGKIEKAPDPPRPAAQAQEPAQTSKRREVVEAGPLGMAVIGWHIPPARDKDVYPLQIASLVLGAGDTARLKTRLKATDPKTKRALGLDGGTEAMVREDSGMVIGVGVFVDKDNEDAIEAAILDEVQKLGAKGPGADELRKAKNQIQSGFTFGLEQVQGLGEAIGRAWIQTGDPAKFAREVDEIEKVTAADVQRVVKQYMTPDKATILVIPPLPAGKETR